MKLSYLPVHFYLRFEKLAKVDNQPLFVLRSVMGKNLRSMCCIAHKNKCADCMYNATCAYSFLFETILQKDNTIVEGRNRASHPFAFTQGAKFSGEIEAYDFTITLFGKAIDFLPYIYAAFVRAGQMGLFRDRVRFEVEDVKVDDKSILYDKERINTDLKAKEIELKHFENAETSKKEILIELKTPLRFKANGKYSIDFSAQDFMNCLYRRTKTLCSLYGETEKNETYAVNEMIEITEKSLKWSDTYHYSARQKELMKLGGVMGTFKIVGEFSDYELLLLSAAKVCNAGKNTNFGLGQLDFWEREKRWA